MIKPIQGPFNWKAVDVTADECWIHRFTPAEQNEIDMGLKHALGKGATLSTLVVEDFPLRTQRFMRLSKPTTKFLTNLVSPSDLEWLLRQSWRTDPTLLARPTSARCTAAKS